ncbi:hypothetical protein V8B97DRAFT_1919934 [Scleroderma yunnanense]
MQKAMHEKCGTVAGLAALCQDLDDIGMDAGTENNSMPQEWLGHICLHLFMSGYQHTFWFAHMQWFKPYQRDQKMIWDDFHSPHQWTEVLPWVFTYGSLESIKHKNHTFLCLWT